MTETTDPPTIAVTGAAGFIGSRILNQFQEEHPEWNLIAIDNFYLGKVRDVGDVTIQHVDIRDRDRLEVALEGADIVIHLAAISGVDDCSNNPDLTFEVNVQGTENVAWFCRKTGAGLVFPFSMAVLGDPDTFPVTAELPRDPMNWYGRTKLLGERSIHTFAEDAFPAHLLMKSNLYGEHEVDGQRIVKGTVINFFVQRVFSEEPLTVYEPGTQSRNYVHVKDIADAYLRSAEYMLEQLDRGETGARTYEIAGNEDPSVMQVAKRVQSIARDVADIETDVTLVENPRSGETLVDEFAADTSRAETELGWRPKRIIDETVEELIAKRVEESS